MSTKDIFFRSAASFPEIRVGDVDFNTRSILKLHLEAAGRGARIIVFPELCVTGYTCADLFGQTLLLDAAEKALTKLAEATSAPEAAGCAMVVGCPLRHQGRLYNCGVLISGGHIRGAVAKSHIPNYSEFYERRWFDPAPDTVSEITIGQDTVVFGRNILFRVGTAAMSALTGIEICEDLWVPQPPSGNLAQAGACIICNLSASDEVIGKHSYLRSLISQQSARCRCGYIYASAGIGESSTDLIFSGNAIIAEDGCVLAESDRFRPCSGLAVADIDIEHLENDRRRTSTFPTQNGCRPVVVDATVDTDTCRQDDIMRPLTKTPFVPSGKENLLGHCEEITSIQAWGLMQRLRSTGCRHAVIGISGGLDSTLALLVTVRAFDMLGLDRKNIIAVTMPGFGTTGRTHTNADTLMKELGVTPFEIPIGNAVSLHFSDIGQDPKLHDATYENSQARERTQILMDLANKWGGMVIGTGDLSELALGWCTYNGDQMSMYGVNASVPKTLVKYLVSYFAENSDNAKLRDTLTDIIDTPISPELIPAEPDGSIRQKTEDLVGPYELHDFFLYHTLRNAFHPEKVFFLAHHAFSDDFDDTTILKWMRVFYRRFFNQQFKRSAMPDGPKVGSVCLSPRGDWRMPSDASSALWLAEVDRIAAGVAD